MPVNKSLTDTLIRNIKPSEKAQKFFDGNGLFLFFAPKKVQKLARKIGD